MKVIIGAAALLFASTQFASAINITGTATAKILQAITATQAQQMNFGTISPAAASGIVTLNTAGTRSSATLSTYGASTAGQINITAAASTPLTITFANGTLTNGANSMVVNNFTSSSTPASNTTDASGTMSINVGADLNVGASQVVGTYNGTYVVTVGY